jgi:hypothetical protein
MTYTPPVAFYWPLWRRIVFRFFFVYLLFVVAPWTWLDSIPGGGYLTQFYYQAMDWAVEMANKHLFHVRPVLVQPNGSGDTSWNWTQIWLLLFVATVGCIVWSIIDRKRTSYTRLNYLTCLFTRYFVIMVLLAYGIIKLFALQMPFPNLSQLATPLGDFLPMRLSWMFIGYSQPYQFFSGAMEVMAALLLLYRKTATLGVLMACAVFINVMVLNLSYDIPVKIYSTQLVVLCLFLLANELRRVIDFFILNRNANAGTIYHFPYSGKKIKITRIVLKIVFIILAIILPFESSWSRYRSLQADTNTAPLTKGIYNVEVYAVNNDSIPALISDSLRWQEMIFDKSWQGSMRTADTAFTHRYGRAYFSYGFDSTKQFLLIKKSMAAKTPIIRFRYQLPNDSTILLWGKRNNDSLFLSLKRSKRRFQLAEKQFHALSEYNR